MFGLGDIGGPANFTGGAAQSDARSIQGDFNAGSFGNREKSIIEQVTPIIVFGGMAVLLLRLVR